MKVSKFYAFLLTLLFLSACHKHVVKNLAPSGLNSKLNFRSELGGNRTNGYENFLEDSESTIHFKITTQYPFNSMHSTQASAYFLTNKWASYDTVQRNYLDVGQVSLNSIYLPKHEKNGYVLFSPTEVQSSQLVSLLGTQVNFKLTGNSANGYPSFSHQMYIPKPLDISFTHPQTYTSNGRLYINRNSSFTLKWTADASNENGVLIRVYANCKVDTAGHLQHNVELSSQTNIILANDDGFYTFTPSDFNGIPDGVELKIWVMRGNVAIEPIGEKTIKMYGCEDVFVSQFLLMP